MILFVVTGWIVVDELAQHYVSLLGGVMWSLYDRKVLES